MNVSYPQVIYSCHKGCISRWVQFSQRSLHFHSLTACLAKSHPAPVSTVFLRTIHAYETRMKHIWQAGWSSSRESERSTGGGKLTSEYTPRVRGNASALYPVQAATIHPSQAAAPTGLPCLPDRRPNSALTKNRSTIYYSSPCCRTSCAKKGKAELFDTVKSPAFVQ